MGSLVNKEVHFVYMSYLSWDISTSSHLGETRYNVAQLVTLKCFNNK